MTGDIGGNSKDDAVRKVPVEIRVRIPGATNDRIKNLSNLRFSMSIGGRDALPLTWAVTQGHVFLL
jgi:hypothetical protein